MDSSPAGLTTVAVWHGGARVDTIQVPLPIVGSDDVLVRIRMSTVCGSDRHTVSGRRASPCPGVLGHEAVGEVVAVGPSGANAYDGTPVVRGDRIVWGVVVSCGHCERCRDGRRAKCRTLRKIGHEAFDADWPLSGCYARHIVLPAGSTLVHAPPRLPDPVVAPAACATATVMAARERAGDLTGRRVLVVGAGMLGLTAIAAVADAGAADIIVTDPNPDRLALAAKFGATRTVGTAAEAPDVDVVVELSGSTAATRDALSRLDIGGAAVLAGAVAPADELGIDPERIVRRWQTITGVHNYEPRHLAAAIDFLDRTARDRPWTDAVAAALPLDRVGELLTRDGLGPPRTSVAP